MESSTCSRPVNLVWLHARNSLIRGRVYVAVYREYWETLEQVLLRTDLDVCLILDPSVFLQFTSLGTGICLADNIRKKTRFGERMSSDFFTALKTLLTSSGIHTQGESERGERERERSLCHGLCRPAQSRSNFFRFFFCWLAI